MKRLFALGLAVSLLQSSVAFAAGPLALPSGSTEAKAEKSRAAAPIKFASFAEAARVGATPPAGVLAQQGGGGAISQTGMGKGTKTLIFAAVGAAFAGIAYGIDHRVKDVTPSSLGERHDNDVFNK
jgi:hypothetical protein